MPIDAVAGRTVAIKLQPAGHILGSVYVQIRLAATADQQQQLVVFSGDYRTDVLFVGYQAKGTPGRQIQTYGSKSGYVVFDGQRYSIKAGIHTLSGYSAHADQNNLVNFVRRMRRPPQRVILVHGELEARQALRLKLMEALPGVEVQIPY